jgi:hypothetical protein
LATDATKVRAATSGAETATLVKRPAAGNRTKVWVGAALVVLLLVGGAGGVYLYKKKQAQQQAATSTQAPAQPSESSQTNNATTSSEPPEADKNSENKIDKVQVDPKQRRITGKQSTAKTNQPANNRAGDQSTTSHDRDRDPERNPPVVTPPRPPDFDPFRNQQTPGHTPETNQTPGTNQMPRVRTFPNGVRIVTQPDGTRIMIMPNGTTRVMPPAQRPRRRPNP